jgi:uncharacterized protein YciU (UPF0263 family)
MPRQAGSCSSCQTLGVAEQTDFMPHQYKRRTMNETQELAQNLFRSEVQRHLSEEEIEELREFGASSGGTPRTDWEMIVGRAVSEREFYEHRVYKPSDVCPYVERIYAVILVSRLREGEECYVQWNPAVEPYDGPWFS